MEDKTKSETGEIDALTIRYNSSKPRPILGDIEMDAKVIRLGLMNQPLDGGAKSKPLLRIVGGKDKGDASSTR